jgi:tRNA(His) 5'-end guanylyltransferase
MKGYENVSKFKLMKRTPVILRLDGKAFHTWTRQLKDVDPGLTDDPFSDIMHNVMAATTEYLVSDIQNAVFGYTQSDEISILLNDWKTLTTDQWFSNTVQKMVSIAASMATVQFNQSVQDEVGDRLSWALFDARAFNIPEAEVANYFLWRQQDATRNSINMLGQFYFSHKELQGKNVSQVQDMLMLRHGVNWNDLDTWKKRGTCVTRNATHKYEEDNGMIELLHGIEIDNEIPIFSKDRSYIEQFLKTDKS